MLPAPANIIGCPLCGKTKEMFSMMSGNTLRGYIRSDGRRIFPMMPSISPILKCNSCGTYSLHSEWKDRGYNRRNHNGTTGTLTYDETKEAYIQLTKSKRYTGDDLLTICLEYIMSYNDQFKRNVDSNEENDDFILFLKATETAIKLLGNNSDALILKSELYRERKEFKDAHDLLLSAYNEENRWVIEPMMYFCNRLDSNPFLLVKNGERIDWTQSNNFIKEELFSKQNRINEEAKSFIDTLQERRRENIYSDSTGGIYEDRRRTLMKILDNCHAHYKISRGTEHIAEFASYRNVNLKSIELPASTRSIGARAFYGCKNLECYSYNGYGPGIISIGDEAFKNCKKIELLSSNLLKHILYIGRGAFSGMENLKEVKLSSGLLELSSFCFACDVALTSITLPSTITKIDEGAFFCTGLTGIELPDSIEKIGNNVFRSCKNLRRVQLSKRIKQIPERAFSFCESLTEIEIPSSVEVIEKHAFYGTKSLKTICFRGKIRRISSSAFKNSAIETVIVPWYLKNDFKHYFPNLTIKPYYL